MTTPSIKLRYDGGFQGFTPRDYSPSLNNGLRFYVATDLMLQPHILDSKELCICLAVEENMSSKKNKREFITTQIIDYGWRILPGNVKLSPELTSI